MKKIHEKDKHFCHYCDWSCFFSEEFSKHLNEVHKEKKLLCCFCDRIYFSEEGLLNHLKKVHDRARITKDSIDRTDHNIQKTQNLNRGGKKPHQCLICFSRFALFKERENHEQEKHFKKNKVVSKIVENRPS